LNFCCSDAPDVPKLPSAVGQLLVELKNRFSEEHHQRLLEYLSSHFVDVFGPDSLIDFKKDDEGNSDNSIHRVLQIFMGLFNVAASKNHFEIEFTELKRVDNNSLRELLSKDSDLLGRFDGLEELSAEFNAFPDGYKKYSPEILHFLCLDF
jgi:hypothetical protein